MSERTASLLELDGVRTGYGAVEVLHGVSLHVDAGEVVALLGRNGAGKTTTLEAIMGNVPPWEGTVTYDGEDVTTLSAVETARRNVALVPEDRRIFPGLTVRENLRLASNGGGTTGSRRSIDEVLGMFENLGEHVDRLGGALSGGEQQMLAIARALVSGVDLLLLDEPTEGLAPFVVRELEALIPELNQEGITVLLVEQNVQVTLDLADRNYVLDQGEVVYHGTSAELRADEDVVSRHLGVTL